MSIINKITHPIAKRLPESNRLERIWKLGQVGFKKRYYNDRLGLLWALLNPALRITVYYLVFTYVLERAREGIDNFAIFLYAGLLLWMAFNEGATAGMRILKSNKHLIKNIQFNHIDLFLSSALSVFMGLGYNTVVFLLVCFFFDLSIAWQYLWFIIPLYINLVLILMGTSMILATIKVYVEDITHLWSVVTLIGFWSSGIFFPASMVLDKFYPMLYINPFVGMIDNLRRITMWGGTPNYHFALINFVVGVLIFFVGYFYFKNYSHKAMERL